MFIDVLPLFLSSFHFSKAFNVFFFRFEIGVLLFERLHSCPRYWAMICAGLDMITPVPIERWDNELYYDPDTSAPGKMQLG